MKLPIITTVQAKQLVGKCISVGGKTFVFDSDIKCGGQAIAMPLKNTTGKRVAYFRSLLASGTTSAKLERMAWMIGQRLHLLSEAFMGAPQLWVNTEVLGRPDGIDFDFAGSIHGIALGASWSSWKTSMLIGEKSEPASGLRLQFAQGLIQRLACLEAVGKSGFTHGDISDANVMLDDASGKVNLIDFECFVFESPTLKNSKLTIRNGGSKGTPGFIPEWLDEDKSVDLAPLGDRFSRDMLLVELLGLRAADLSDASPLYFYEEDQEEMLDGIRALTMSLKLDHLQDVRAFKASESERPSSFELADKLNLPIENNVSKTLASPPVALSGVPSDAAPDTSQSDETTNQTSERVQEFELPKIPKVEELPGIILRESDRAVIAIGKWVLPLMKFGAVGVLAIAATVLWILLLVYLLLNLGLPANLIACGVVCYATYLAIGKFKSSER